MSNSSTVVDERADGSTATETIDATQRGRVEGFVTGLKAGVVATVAMSAFRMPISKSPPPTAWFWAKYLGEGNHDDYVGRGLLLHLLYGSVGGAVFGAAVAPAVTGGEANRERRGTLYGFVYGVLLSGFGVSVVLKRVLGLELDSDEKFVFRVSHVIYGLTLGTWFGSRI